MNQTVLASVVINNKIIKEDERKFLMTVISSHVVNESISLKRWHIAYNFHFLMNYLHLIPFDSTMFLL